MTRVSLQHACVTSLGALTLTTALALCHPAVAGDDADSKVHGVAVEIRPTDEKAKPAEGSKPESVDEKKGEAKFFEHRVIRVDESGPANIVITKGEHGIATIEVRSDEGVYVMNGVLKPQHSDPFEHLGHPKHHHSKAEKVTVLAEIAKSRLDEIAKAKEKVLSEHRKFELKQKELQQERVALEKQLLMAQQRLHEAAQLIADQQESLDAPESQAVEIQLREEQ